LKEEVPKPLLATLAPIPSNMTYLIDDAVEQNEPHHAADIEEHKNHNDPDDYEQGDTDRPQQGICGHSLSEELIRPIRYSKPPWDLKAGTPASCDFSGEQTDQGNLYPLPEPERLKQLLFHVLESGLNDVGG
jgi:hypothetical protein